MKNAACVTILISLLVAITTTSAIAGNPSETRTIDVIGSGRIHGENVSSARDQAISDCLVTAISLVATDLLQKQVFLQYFQDINRLLFSGSDQFIQNYRVLTEDTTGRVYRVMVETTVSVEKIRDILIQNDILSQNIAPLKVLLLIAEQDFENESFKYWWGGADSETVSEASLSDALIEQGFVVINHERQGAADNNSDVRVEAMPNDETGEGQTAAPVEEETAMLDENRSWPVFYDPDALAEAPSGPEMSNSQAAAFGAGFQADVVIVGTAGVKKAANVLGDSLKSFEGALSARAIRIDTGGVLAEADRKFLTADADDFAGSRRALIEVGSRTGELLAGNIMTAWQQTSKQGPTAATIVVEGGFQLSHLVAFRGILSAMPGVSALQTRGMTPEETVLSLDYDGTTKKLAEALLLNSFEGFGVHIAEATPNEIRLSLVSN